MPNPVSAPELVKSHDAKDVVMVRQINDNFQDVYNRLGGYAPGPSVSDDALILGMLWAQVTK